MHVRILVLQLHSSLQMRSPNCIFSRYAPTRRRIGDVGWICSVATLSNEAKDPEKAVTIFPFRRRDGTSVDQSQSWAEDGSSSFRGVAESSQPHDDSSSSFSSCATPSFGGTKRIYGEMQNPRCHLSQSVRSLGILGLFSAVHSSPGVCLTGHNPEGAWEVGFGFLCPNKPVDGYLISKRKEPH
jgi:hypothetical protein